LCQTYTNIEYIIIDAGSEDGTVDVLREYENKISYWISEHDNGIYDAWNKALKKATGDWILFLGAGDHLRENGIFQLIQEASKYNFDLDLVSAKVNLFNEKKNLRVVGSRWIWSKFRKYMCIAHPSTLHNKRLFIEHGNYNDNFKVAGDYELLLRAGSTIKSGFVDEIVVDMKFGGVSNSNVVLKETYYAQKIHKVSKFTTILLINSLFTFIKFHLRKLNDNYFN
jgi:glycosyltransferase involved in cell wall biosynthesis